MRKSDWDKVRKGKDAHRDEIATLPFGEKIQLLERLHARTLAFGVVRDSMRTPMSTSGVFTQGPTLLNKTFATIGTFGASAPLIAAMTMRNSFAVNRGGGGSRA